MSVALNVSEPPRLHAHSANLRVPDWFDRPLVDRADSTLEAGTGTLFGEQVSPEAARLIRRIFRRVRGTQERSGPRLIVLLPSGSARRCSAAS